MVPLGTDRMRWPLLPDLLFAAVVLTGVAGGLRIALDLPAGIMPLALAGYFVLAGLLWYYRGQTPLTPADRITIGRAVLVMLLFGLLWAAEAFVGASHLPFALALVAVALDGVDGFVARRFDCQTAAGARFDMELDAFLLLILCGWVIQLDRVGAWVLLIGLWRYGFVLAGKIHPPLRRPLPPSQRRRVICLIQGLGLVALLAPGFPEAAAAPLAAILLALVSVSFVIDIAASLRAAH